MTVVTARWATWRRRTAGLVIASLLSVMLVGVTAGSANAVDCVNDATSICATASTGSSTNSGGGPSSGGSNCPATQNVTPTTYTTEQYNYFCGSATFSNSTASGWPSPLPGPFGPLDNQYSMQGYPCMGSFIVGHDPLTGKAKNYYATGLSYVDKQHFATKKTTTSGVSFTVGPVTVPPYTTQTVNVWTPQVFNPFAFTAQVIKTGKTSKTVQAVFSATTQTTTTTNYYLGRNVAYYCNFPYTPYTATIPCSTSLGPGYMVGPIGNKVTHYPSTNPSTGWIDPLTQTRKWIASPSGVGINTVDKDGSTVLSPVGVLYRDHPSWFVSGNNNSSSANASLAHAVLNCVDIKYTSVAHQGSCWNHANVWVTDKTVCAFTPGIYTKSANGKEIKCRIGILPYEGTTEFVGCNGAPAPCPSCSVNYSATFYCANHNPTSKNDFADQNYNFLTCGGSIVNPAPKCTWSGSLGLTSPDGTVVSNGAQAAANGKIWTISFPRAGTTRSVDNQWTELVMVDGSEPYKTGLSPRNSTQSFSASFTRGGSSVITSGDEGAGANGWSQNTTFLQLFKSAPTPGVAFSFGAGQVSNPVSVAATSVNPFGMYLVYHFTWKYTTATDLGGAVTINVPGTCETKMAYVYPVSGRVTK
jgi:hypothetical protein